MAAIPTKPMLLASDSCYTPIESPYSLPSPPPTPPTPAIQFCPSTEGYPFPLTPPRAPPFEFSNHLQPQTSGPFSAWSSSSSSCGCSSPESSSCVSTPASIHPTASTSSSSAMQISPKGPSAVPFYRMEKQPTSSNIVTPVEDVVRRSHNAGSTPGTAPPMPFVASRDEDDDEMGSEEEGDVEGDKRRRGARTRQKTVRSVFGGLTAMAVSQPDEGGGDQSAAAA
ncbi:hypothetical protein MNV49_000448 [Pseudohyphozyma bogoriensis]|nr:hypothetical protein MNV49_000448 [Pseudohyphozyma bogoriensis]